MDRLELFAIILVLIFPIAYALGILWAAKYRFRSTPRNWLIATTIFALLLGVASAIATRLSH